MADNKGQKPVINIIRRKKKGHEEEPHSAAWKIAYADFMTAMMAFFLVMWLISSMSPSQRKGIANYFDPVGTTEGASGVGGVLGGTSITVDGPLSQMSAASRINPPLGSEADTDDSIGAYKTPDHATGTSEQEALEEIQHELERAFQMHPGLKEVVEMAQVTLTLEGLQIDLIESFRKPMFPLGSSELTPEAKELLDVLGVALRKLPNKINITGHTDARLYAGQRFTNWELSSERALVTRRYLVERAPTLRLNAVVGKAASSPYVQDDPTSPLNRRMSILVMRQFEEKGAPDSKQEANSAKSKEGRKDRKLYYPDETSSSLLKIQEIH